MNSDAALLIVKEQLEKYRALMQLRDYDIHGGISAAGGHESGTVKLGLYFPLLQGWREWEYQGPVE